MNAVFVTLVCLLCYYIAFRFYAKFLSDKVFSLNPKTKTPAHELRDDIDYIPSNKYVLFGHHYASITGLSPMLGPAIAVIWGWVPGLLWVVIGSIFVGCVHDLGSIVVSMRAKSMSIGKVAEGIIGKRSRTLFHIIIFFLVSLAMGVFVYVIALLFTYNPDFPKTSYPQAVLPSASLMLIAVMIGIAVYKKGMAITPVTAVGFVIMLILVYCGMKNPIIGPTQTQWSGLLLGYAFLASVLPVWLLLQPRDYINSLLLYLGMIMMYGGFFWMRPNFVSPALDLEPAGAPPIFPFVFIIIACGAASGFHSLVSSGTTAKQIDKETDARFIGYGGMIGESMLGLMAVLACTSGFISYDAWSDHYGNWSSAQGLGNGIGAFIYGTSRFISSLGIPYSLSSTFTSVIVVSFALTSLDSATRLLRYNISEISETIKIPILANRYISSALAVLAIAWFAFYNIGGKAAGLALWQLFGTTNQLMAGLALLVITLYLMQRGRNFWFAFVPMVFMLVTTLTAMMSKIRDFWMIEDFPLLVVGSILFIIAIWLTVEAVASIQRFQREGTVETLMVEFEDAAS